MIVAIMIFVFIVLILLRIPVAFALGLSTLFITFITKISPTMVIQQTYRGLDSFPLLAVPFFLLVGQLMNDNGVTTKLINLSDATVGHIRGGLGHVNVLVSMIFAGMSGSSTADTASIGIIMIPQMIKKGYSKEFSVAVTAASSTIGVIIPPSIMMIIYGAMGGASTGALLVAGIIPGIIVGIGQMFLVYLYAVKNKTPIYGKLSFNNFFKRFKQSFLALLVPLILVGGIISGLFTPTEASMVAVVYTLFLGFIYRSTNRERILTQFTKAVKLYSITLFCVGTATCFSWILAYYKTPELVIKILGPWLDHPSLILFLVMVIYLFLGTIIDAIPAIIILLPVLSRLNVASNINPLHMGIVVCMTLALGLVTPPYGLCLLMASKIGGIDSFYAFKSMLPFAALFVFTIILIILVPEIALWLPKIFFPRLFL